MAEHDCPHMKACPMYSLLTLSGTLKVWQMRYCQSEYTTCARYKLSTEGRAVPINLMPNGAKLRQGGKPSDNV